MRSLLALLLALLPACAEAQVSAADAERTPAANAGAGVPEPGRPPESAQPPARPPRLALHPALVQDVERIASAAVESAGKETKGRVRAGDVRVAVHVRDLRTGAVLVARGDEEPMRPASCMKLVTTAAALVLLGPDWAFETGFDAAGPLRAGTLEGDLVVRAAGDPLYAGDRPDGVSARLDEVARALAAAGVRRVTGDLVLDLAGFEDAAPGPEWPDASQHWQDYCALAAGLSANGGILRARVAPGAVGGPADVRVWPADHGLPRRYTTTTVAEAVNDVRVGATRSAATVAGRIGVSLAPVEAGFAHPDPVLAFEHELRAALARAGVALGSGTRRVRGAPMGQRLFTLRSPLLAALEPVNAHSVNSVADHVFFALARAESGAATRAAGQAAVERALGRLGVSTRGFAQVDGSGLSRGDRVSARQLCALLAAVLGARPDARDAYLGSLAVAGESGTLAGRMADGAARGRVLGKTGWIAGTSSLAGIVRARDGAELVFAILVDYPAAEGGLNTRVFKPMHDAVAERLAQGLAGEGAVR